MRICKFEGCNKKHDTRGYCRKHYDHLRRTGKAHLLDKAHVRGVCSIEGCDNKHYIKGLCEKHYLRLKKYGDSSIVHTARACKTLKEALFFRTPVKNDGECWEWTGAKLDAGYGIFQFNHHKNLSAHRVSYEVHKGAIPKGLIVRHTCDNPSCINPEHLVLGTHKENSQDMVIRERSLKGVRHHNAKLTNAKVLEIDRKLCGGANQAMMAKDYNVTPECIHAIKIGASWGWLTGRNNEKNN